MSLDVNGKRIQTGNTSTMIFTVAEIIEHLSSLMTLYTGDVISLTIDDLGQQLQTVDQDT